MKKYDVMSTMWEEVLFTAEVDDAIDQEPLLKRAAVEWAIRNKQLLIGVDLSDADLSGLDLSGQNLTGTGFVDADLTGAILTGAIFSKSTLFTGAVMTGVTYDPALKVDDLDGRILKAIKKGGTLDMSDWHHCKTSHCRAGWAIVMAGRAGKALEKKVGPALAGTLIYAASYPTLPIPDLYCSTDEAMADIEKGAALAA